MIKLTQFDVEFVNLGSLKKGWMSLELNVGIGKFKSKKKKSFLSPRGEGKKSTISTMITLSINIVISNIPKKSFLKEGPWIKNSDAPLAAFITKLNPSTTSPV